MSNRIWIELAKPQHPAHAKEQVRLANNMLRRLRGGPIEQGFEYDEDENAYYFGGYMGSEKLVDGGKWFNLDFLGRELP